MYGCKPDSVPFAHRSARAVIIYLTLPTPCEASRVGKTGPQQPSLAIYLAFQPTGFASAMRCRMTACALTARFHPCLCSPKGAIGGVFSVALSVTAGSLPQCPPLRMAWCCALSGLSSLPNHTVGSAITRHTRNRITTEGRRMFSI